MSLRLLLAFAASACLLTSVAAPRKISTIKRDIAKHSITDVAAFDTIVAPESSLRLSGYDKQLRSRREAFFVTSTCPDTITGFILTLEYTDLSDRQMHKRTVSVTLPEPLPPSQTRRVEIGAWDKQGAFYYHRSNPPKRTAATPYKVKATVTHLLKSR